MAESYACPYCGDERASEEEMNLHFEVFHNQVNDP